jgi:hypothetical protein
MRENASLIRKVQHLDYWIASRRPAIFVCAPIAAQRRRLAWLVTRDFESWWQLHKGSWERTFWRTRANLPASTEMARPRAKEIGRLPQEKGTGRGSRWRIKPPAPPFGPTSKEDLNIPLGEAVLSFTGLKGYRVVRATSNTALQTLDTCLVQWRKRALLKRQAKEQRLFSLVGVFAGSSRSRNKILEYLLGNSLYQNGSRERIFKACRSMQQVLSWWRTQVEEFQWLRQLGRTREHTTGSAEGMEYYELRAEGEDHDSSGDEASDIRHRQIEMIRSIVGKKG